MHVRLALFTVPLLLISTVVLAAQRTFVASTGNDANTCALAQPCRSFATAITHTDANGEIIVLDSAGYGGVTITQSVSIISPPGIYAGISVFTGQDGITINAAIEKVVLRGLSINGQGGMHGVRVVAATQVHVENCEISNMSGDGVRAESGIVHVAGSVVRANTVGVHVTGTNAKVYVDDTRVAHNLTRGIHVEAGTIAVNRIRAENNGNSGIEANALTAGTVRVSVRDSWFVGNGADGVLALAQSAVGTIDVTVESSHAWQNALDGFGAQSFSNGVVNLILSDSVSTENGEHGLVVTGGGAKAAVSGNTLSHNASTGMIQSIGSVLDSHGNNALRDNVSGSDASGTINAVGLQ